jgi:hypothetical protein
LEPGTTKLAVWQRIGAGVFAILAVLCGYVSFMVAAMAGFRDMGLVLAVLGVVMFGSAFVLARRAVRGS